MATQLLQDFNLGDQTLTDAPDFTSTKTNASTVLQIVSGALKHDVPNIDLVNDKFIHHYHDTNLDTDEPIVQVAGWFDIGGISCPVDVLIGLSLCGSNPSNASDLVGAAFDDCYYATIVAAGTDTSPTVGQGIRVYKRVAGVSTLLAQNATTHFMRKGVGGSQTFRFTAEDEGGGKVLRFFLDGVSNTDPDFEKPLIEIFDNESTLQTGSAGRGHGFTQKGDRTGGSTSLIDCYCDNYRAEDKTFAPAAPALPTIASVTDPITPLNETVVAISGEAELDADLNISIRNQ